MQKHRRLRFLIPALGLLLSLGAAAQSVSEFRRACDSLTVRMQRRTSVKSKIALRSIQRSGDVLDFRFTKEFSDYPWTPADTAWFEEELWSLMPAKYRSCTPGLFYADVKSQDFPALVTLSAGKDGKPSEEYAFRMETPPSAGWPLVVPLGRTPAPRGLDGRHIALWQSHGRYFEQRTERWEWQRAPTFQTTEDLFTQSFVLPFLIPMLENAGAVVMTPRERDTQPLEVVVDNDPAFTEGRDGKVRRCGMYAEEGSWDDAGTGFADARAVYDINDNPFRMGTARKARTVSAASSVFSQAQWNGDLPERGRYAVYVSYKTIQGSTNSAHYTVRHRGGTSEFIVNQRIGGGTWVYLGTFDFDKGGGLVTLDNATPEGRTYRKGEYVTADAVRFGGGMGKVARGASEETSGLPAYLEGAMYAMQWAGFDGKQLKDEDLDYTNDYARRGAWVRQLSGGSSVNPKYRGGLGIPVDLSLAFHTDAGTTPNDSIVGTLAIYTLLCDNKPELDDGTSRAQCRDFAALLQDQVVGDLRAQADSKWSRRQLWNRSYSESRTTGVPGMILELLSHQNFADMKYGLDPRFRFLVSRAVYKGILKFLAERYGHRYVVQPLPVRDFAVTLDGDGAVLRWAPTEDELEPTAAPKGYLLYTRVDDGAFDLGKDVGDGLSCRVDMQPGHVYSFFIVAVNDGGRSFPSETLSAGRPARKGSAPVLIVNNFTRLSAPAWFDTPVYAGFDNGTDSGVPYLEDISYAGRMYGFRRLEPWLDDDCPGFGGSYVDEAGKVTPGNTFDYPSVHGKALLESGHPFWSSSASAFMADSTLRRDAFAIDLICGKQVTTRLGRGEQPDSFTVFPDQMQAALTAASHAGVHLIISGARIGTDIWSGIYGDSVGHFTDDTPAALFATTVLGWRWRADRPTRSFDVAPYSGKPLVTEQPVKKGEKTPPPPPLPPTFSLGGTHVGRADRYVVDNPDGIVPAADGAFTLLRYADTRVDAAVAYAGGLETAEDDMFSEGGAHWHYGAVSFGFPLEVLPDADLAAYLRAVLDWFGRL